MKKRKEMGRIRVLALFLALTLAFSPALESVALASSQIMDQVGENTPATKTRTTSRPLIRHMSLGDYYAQDVFKVTYVPSTGVITAVEAFSETSLPKELRFLEYDPMVLASKKDKVWTYTSTWYLNMDMFPASMLENLKKKIPMITVLTGLGRVATIQITYKVKGNGKVARTKVAIKPTNSGKLKSTIKWLVKLLLS